MKHSPNPHSSPHPSAAGASTLCLALVVAAVLASANAQPTNDNFASRGHLSGANLHVAGSLAGASFEPGEPFIQEVSSGQTAWWTWSAPSNGILTLSVLPTAPAAPLLAVYVGGDLADLSLVASNNYISCYDWCGGTSTLHWLTSDHTTLHVARGQAYQIAVDAPTIAQAVPVYAFEIEPGVWGYSLTSPLITWSTNTAPAGDYSLGLQFTPAPANDDFAHAMWLRGSRTQVTASNAGATVQPGEPLHLGNPGGSSVWYSWTAPASGRVTLSTNALPAYAPPSSTSIDDGEIDTMPILVPSCATEHPLIPPPTFFPIFAAYTGTAVSALTPANCLPLSMAAYNNAVCFDAVKGQTYHIAFDGNMGTTGTTPLCLALTKPAINDGFAHRITLHGIYATAKGYNAGATQQTGEPAIGDGSTGKTVWWSWTAPVDGTVSIDLTGSDFGFPVAVFTGSSLGSLNQVAADSGGVSFQALAGQIYQIAVGDDAGLTGAINLVLQAPIIDLALSRQPAHFSSHTMLTYAAISGQKVLLERSADGSTWRSVQTLVARGNLINFMVNAPPADNGPFYRAIIIDRSFQ